MTVASSIKANGIIESIQTNKARYNPGDDVTFSLRLNSTSSNWRLNVRYRYLFDIIGTDNYTASSGTHTWQWHVPDYDFRGYLVEIALVSDTTLIDAATIGVDVSSEWSKFPRYGFLSKYPRLNQSEIDNTLATLNRYHINGLQFYDWHYKHHMPLRGTPENPAASWPDIANRTNYFSTIENYILTAQRYNMKTMAYNLLYGAMENASQDGVSDEWCLFTDPNRSNKDYLDLSFWGHYIYLMDPNNRDWKDYIFEKMQQVYQALDFDGWHIDQLGDRGTRWNYQQQPVIIRNAFKTYLSEAQHYLNIPLITNAVNQYGQEEIAQSPVDFLYTEVWSPNDNFADLAQIITDNRNYSNNSLNSVLAAYINYDLSGSPGRFNPPAVLMADAVIFAFGGAHLELGEHMLAHEYFPNDNLQMPDELQEALIRYYDFLVGYQNLLRDGGDFINPGLSSQGPISLHEWPPQRGWVTTMSRKIGSRLVFHLLNFLNASTLEWRDNSGTWRAPAEVTDLALTFTSQDTVRYIWAASPDINNGSPTALSFTQHGETVTFHLSYLKYWQMIVVEYERQKSISKAGESSCNGFFTLYQIYPNPMKQSAIIPYTLHEGIQYSIAIYNILGQKIKVLVDTYNDAGDYQVSIDPQTLSTGIYFYSLETSDCIQTKKLLIVH